MPQYRPRISDPEAQAIIDQVAKLNGSNMTSAVIQICKHGGLLYLDLLNQAARKSQFAAPAVEASSQSLQSIHQSAAANVPEAGRSRPPEVNFDDL